METKDCCGSIVLFVGSDYLGRNMMKEVVCHHVMPHHIMSYQYLSYYLGKQWYPCFFSFMMPPKLLLQVARQATGQKKAAALKEDKAGLQCCDVVNRSF